MKNKILPILCIFILFSFIFINNNVFAASYDLSDYSNHVGSKNWMIIYIVAKDEFQLITTSEPYLYGNQVHLEEVGYCWIDSTVLSAGYLTTNPWGDSGNYVQIYKFDNSTKTFSYSSQTRFYDITDSYIIASNCKVYNAVNSSVFFQPTPVASTVVVPWETTQKVEIPAVETVEQIPETIVETVKMIIPVGLVVLSAVLVIYLVQRLIYRFS